MRITFEVPYFQCPELSMVVHLRKVFEGEYDVPLIYADAAPTILDVGANFGAFSMWASHRWPGSKIHAFEPHPKTVVTLRQNMANYPNVKVHNYAVGEAGIRVLLNGQIDSGGASLYMANDQTNLTGQHVEVTDPLSLPEAQILKMDTEGAEVEILEPLIAAGRKFDAIMFEYHRADDRRKIDALLTPDYTLTGASVFNPCLGTFRYVRKDLL